jgi:hypothetical protein
MATIRDLRRAYHGDLCSRVIFLKESNIPNMADTSNRLSCAVSSKLLDILGYQVGNTEIKEQTAGKRFEQITKDFLEKAFRYLQHVRPGEWKFSANERIWNFDQYRHISELARLIRENKALKTAFGDYVISPDIIVARLPVSDNELNRVETLVTDDELPQYTPLRATNNAIPILHASISCKWTIRSDRSQNARTEGLNLIRNRKGNTPHVAVVTGEPTPGRIASLALGTGDIDCVYHFALHELVEAVKATNDETAIETLGMMIDGRRLRDISDLPFDLAV